MKSIGFVIEESVKDLPLSDYTAPCLPDAPEQEDWLEEAMLRKVSRILNYVTPGFVLFHAFGRVGCLLAGCCYGFSLATDWQILGIVFHYFPLQAVEAVFEFMMFVFLVRFIPEQQRCRTYLLIYSIYRFAAEFFRGDTERGIWLILSTSQWISILIVISLMLHWIRCKAITDKTVKNSCNQEKPE